MDRLLTEAMASVDQEQRRQLYGQAQILAANEAPWIFMFNARHIAATKKEVTGLVLNPNMNNLKFNTVQIGG